MENRIYDKWMKKRQFKNKKISQVQPFLNGKFIETDKIIPVLETILDPGMNVALEGNNQKQADFLSRNLASVDPEKVNGLHLIMSSVSRSEHLDLFEKNIAATLDFSYSGSQSVRLSQMIQDGDLKINNFHTYLELFGRLFVDLIPNVALVAADKADLDGNLYTGFNTEETPTIIEATAFKDGIVICQVNEVVEKLPRVDIPSSWVDIIVPADRPYELKPIFTRDPEKITEIQILMAMLTIRGIYQKHQVQSLNHGIGFNTAAIELLLPTYGNQLGLKGKIAKQWVLNPHPTMIPAIESGWVENIHCFGGEVGMEKYISARPDIFFVGPDGTLRSNRTLSQVAGQYAVDLFIGSTLQMDELGNSSTVTDGRISGFGGAPNMGSDPSGRRHATLAWLDLQTSNEIDSRGRKLVVQMTETFNSSKKPVFVSSLDAVKLKKEAELANVPIMIYSEDTTHIVTEEGIAYLYKTTSLAEKKQAVSAIAGITPIGLKSSKQELNDLRKRGIVALPEDLGVSSGQAKRSLLAAQSIASLVEWSQGLYQPPIQFRNWS